MAEEDRVAERASRSILLSLSRRPRCSNPFVRRSVGTHRWHSVVNARFSFVSVTKEEYTK